MTLRRIWALQEDIVLKMLKEQRKVAKWNSIARIMHSQFHMEGRQGKQCRQRYINHLSGHLNQNQLTQEQQHKLIEMHQKYGNKWKLIAQLFQNRSANFLKNQLYSKFRKALRKLNRWARKNNHLKKTSFSQFSLDQNIQVKNHNFKNNKMRVYKIFS